MLEPTVTLQIRRVRPGAGVTCRPRALGADSGAGAWGQGTEHTEAGLSEEAGEEKPASLRGRWFLG